MLASREHQLISPVSESATEILYDIEDSRNIGESRYKADVASTDKNKEVVICLRSKPKR